MVVLCIQNASISGQEDVPAELPSVIVEDLSLPVEIASVSGKEDVPAELPSVIVEDLSMPVEIASILGKEELPSVTVEEDLPLPVEVVSISGKEENVPVEPVEDNVSGLQSATFPAQAEKRGRPKGSCTTAIGLPRMKKQKTDGKPLPFFRKFTKSRQMYILKMLVGEGLQQGDNIV